jgi:hypothetical protein
MRRCEYSSIDILLLENWLTVDGTQVSMYFSDAAAAAAAAADCQGCPV